MSVNLLGYKINDYSFEGAIKTALDLVNSGHKVSQVVTINPEMFKTAEDDEQFAKILNSAEMVVPDGIGVKIGLKIKGHSVERIAGVDFAYQLLKEAAKYNIPVAIVGAKEEIVNKAVENIKNQIENLNIVYYHNGYFNNDEMIYNEIKAHSPKIVLVALGSPRQEKFIYNAKSKLEPSLMIGIGGSLDVWSGVVKRAPKIYQKLGLEWLYRTLLQPERFKRIFPTLPLFLLKVIFYKDDKNE